MKIYFLISLCVLALTDTSAQTNTFPSAGNVGIGIVTPTTSLYIQNSNTTYASTLTLKNTTNSIAARVGLTMENDIGNQTYLYKQASGNSDANDVVLYSQQGHTRIYTGGLERLRITHSGNIGINTTNPTEKLSVKGNIRAKEIKVEATNWPDYVFADDYKTMSLPDLEKYIVQNKHLPAMPTAKEVEKEGVALGEMNKKLLEKLEEVTLHLIDLDKKVRALEKENLKLKNDLKTQHH